MKHLRTEITINAPIEKVWDALTQLDNYKNWNPFIVSSEGETVVGRRLTNKMINKGKTIVFRPVVTKFDEFREFEWLGSAMMGMFRGRHYFILEDAGNGRTRLIHGEKFSGLLSGIILRIIGEATLENFRKMNKALKAAVEKG